VKWHQADTTAEGVQTLRERGTMLRCTYPCRSFIFVFRLRFIVNALGQAELEEGANIHLLAGDKTCMNLTVHRNIIAKVKPNRCTNVSNLLYFAMTLYVFRTVFPVDGRKLRPKHV